MKKLVFVLLLVCQLGALHSCKRPDLEEEAKSIKRSYEAYLPEVSVTKLEKSDFSNEIVSNGTLEAFRKTEIKSQADGKLVRVNVTNGQKVLSGALMASIDYTEAKQKLQRSNVDYTKAILELEDQLINYGVSLADTLSLDKGTLNSFKIKSGYSNAWLALKEVQYELTKTKITAPFSGRVANLEQKQYSHISSGEDFCLLIDDQRFEVVFPLIEAEVALLKKGHSIKVLPFSFQATYEGVISEINPLVDENGLVQVKAFVENLDGRLLEGLNVRVIAQQNIGSQLVVPKKALLQRDGRKVVFTLRNDSTAYWNYVQVGLENVDNYTITDGLREGELIIVEGNLNLAHESKVKLKSMNN